MAKYSPEVETDIRTQSTRIGIVLGILCLPFSFFAGALGGCCPLGSFIGVVPVAFAGGIAGQLAAMFLDWRKVRYQDAMGVGVKVGMRTALVASSIGAAVTFLVSLFSGGGLASSAATAGEGAAVFGSVVILNALTLLVGIVPGVLLGILGGVIGAAIKRPAGESLSSQAEGRELSGDS